MTKRNKTQQSMVEEIRSQVEEINKYKWIESEKAGQDIGWERAYHEWMQEHFPEWKHYHWQRALRDALRNADRRPRTRQAQLS